MHVIQDFKCPCCDGAIEFDSTLQKMKCPYCGTEFETETIEAYNNALNTDGDNMSWDTSAGSEWDKEEADTLRSYICNHKLP